MQLDDADLIDLITDSLPGTRIGVAVSGGSDSMALLHLLNKWSQVSGAMLFCATVNHGLRSEATAEADFVANICVEMKIPHQILTWTGDKSFGNLQANARRARYDLLAGWAASHELDTVCLGHTQDDVAETFLMRLGRRAGVDGLSEMRQVFGHNSIRFMRPFLPVSRSDLRSFLERNGNGWCEDSSNNDEKFNRVKVRKMLVGLQAAGISPQDLQAVAQNMTRVRDGLSAMAHDAAARFVRFDRGDVLIDPKFVQTADDEILSRIINAALKWISGASYPPRRETLERLSEAMRNGETMAVAGCLVGTNKDAHRLTRELNDVISVSCSATEIWDGRWSLSGPLRSEFTIRALGEDGLTNCPSWRVSEMPRVSLLASPSVWKNDRLIAAPLANMNPEWAATLTRCEKQFFSSIVTH